MTKSCHPNASEASGRAEKTIGPGVAIALVPPSEPHAAAIARTHVVGYTPPEPFSSLWLGDPMGKVLYLTVAWWRDEMPIRNIGKLAQEPKAPIG